MFVPASSIQPTSERHPTVLVVDENPEVRQLLRNALSAEQYSLLEATTGAIALAQLQAVRPALVLVELDLPDMDGLELIRDLRLQNHRIPIIVVSARSSEHDRIHALDTGADDFVSKPFSTDELLARVRVALRHVEAVPADINVGIFRAGDIEVDFDHRRIRVSDREVHLSPREYRLLQLFVSNADRVVTYGHLLREVWRSNDSRNMHLMRVYIAQLRRKLDGEPGQHRYLVTEPGIGYRFQTHS